MNRNFKHFKKWNDLSQIEKFFVGFIIILLIAIALNWSRVYEGIKKGITPYQTEQNEK